MLRFAFLVVSVTALCVSGAPADNSAKDKAQEVKEMTNTLFGFFDRDKNGTITTNEVQKADDRLQSFKRFLDTLKEMDRNNDGVVS